MELSDIYMEGKPNHLCPFLGTLTFFVGMEVSFFLYKKDLLCGCIILIYDFFVTVHESSTKTRAISFECHTINEQGRIFCATSEKKAVIIQ